MIRTLAIAAAAMGAVGALLAIAWRGREARPAPPTPPQTVAPQAHSAPQPAPRLRDVPRRAQPVRLCQALGPAAPHPIWAVDSARGSCDAEVGWDARDCAPWQSFAQGEYVGHARLAHVPEYRLRVDDSLAVFYLRTREVQAGAYTLQVGDRIRVESLTAGSGVGAPSQGRVDTAGASSDDLNREVAVQPDGTIWLPLVGRVTAAGRTVAALRDDLEERFTRFYRVPAITVTPLEVDTRLEDLLDTVDSRGAINGGRQLGAVVTPAGKIQLPGLGSVYVQGLTLQEAKQEIDARYAQTIPGVSVTVDLTERAERYVYVLGEVEQPGRFVMEAPTSAMQAIALAGGWRMGANLRQVVVFRRGPDWRLMATMLDLRGALYARRPAPADEIWLNDSDIVLVPKTPIKVADELVEQIFTRGVYAAVPLELIWGQGFATVSAITSSF